MRIRVSATLIWLGLLSAGAMGAEAPRLIYASPGRIMALDVQPGSEQRSFLVVESHREEGTQGNPVRLRRLTMPSGQLERIVDLPKDMNVPGKDYGEAYAADGSVAIEDARTGGDLPQTAIQVWSPQTASWRQVTPWEKGANQIILGWSEDSTSLLYASFVFARAEGAPSRRMMVRQFGFRVASDVRSGEFVEKVLVPEAGLNDSVSWSADGRQLYYVHLGSNRPTLVASRLDAISWPSLATKTVFVSPSIGSLAVAENSGALYWASWAERPLGAKDRPKGSIQIWCMPPGGEPQQTELFLERFPGQMMASPDGRLLAAITADGNLVICNPERGSKFTPAGLPHQKIQRVQWAMGGKALLALVGDSALWLVPVSRDDRKG